MGTGIIYAISFFTGVDAMNTNARDNANTDTNANVARNANANGDTGDVATNTNAKDNANMDSNANMNVATNDNSNGDAVGDINSNAKYMGDTNDIKANGDTNNENVNFLLVWKTILMLILLKPIPIQMLILRLMLMGKSAHLHRKICLRSMKMIINYMMFRKNITTKLKL